MAGGCWPRLGTGPGLLSDRGAVVVQVLRHVVLDELTQRVATHVKRSEGLEGQQQEGGLVFGVQHGVQLLGWALGDAGDADLTELERGRGMAGRVNEARSVQKSDEGSEGAWY